MEPHPRRAVFVYHYGGDFRGNPEAVLAKYYDAMFYLANWGSRHLLFRFPAALVDAAAMAQYSVETTDYPSEAITVETVGEYVVLGIRLDEEEGFGWVDGEGWLDRLLGLREALLQRDDRVLYLAWLKGIVLDCDADRTALEPPVPPGLNELTPALQAFVELFDVDETLLGIAAARSAVLKPVAVDEAQLQQAIAGLPAAEKDAFLLRLAHDEPRLSLALRQHLGLSGQTPVIEAGTRRTAGELLEAVGFVVEDF